MKNVLIYHKYKYKIIRKPFLSFDCLIVETPFLQLNIVVDTASKLVFCWNHPQNGGYNFLGALDVYDHITAEHCFPWTLVECFYIQPYSRLMLTSILSIPGIRMLINNLVVRYIVVMVYAITPVLKQDLQRYISQHRNILAHYSPQTIWWSIPSS